MSTPTGTFLKDGHSTVVSFTTPANVKFSELTVQPPGYTLGGGIPTTGMRNTRVRTQAPKKLVSVGASKITAKYNPVALEDCYALLGVNQLITITHPDNSTTAAWGWLEEFVPGENEEGNLPIADLLIEWSNENASGVETKPVSAVGA